MQAKKLIIFDLDGTLVDSSRAIANAINHVRNYLGFEPMPKNSIISHLNDTTIDGPRFFYHAKEYTPLHQRVFSQYYQRNHHHELDLYEGIFELLEGLKQSNTKLAVATNGYRNTTIEVLRTLKIAELFDCVVCFDDVSRPKPSGDMLHTVMQSLSCNASETLFVGDGVRDEEAAMDAGVDFLLVGWGFDGHESNAIASVEELHKRLLNG